MEHSTCTVRTNKPIFHTARVFSPTPSNPLAKPLSQKVVKKILKVTGREFLRADIDTDDLAIKLGNCRHWLRYLSRPTGRELISARRKYLRKVKQRVEALQHYMRAALPRGPWRKEDSSLSDRTALLSLDVDQQLRDLQKSGLPTSVFEWLVGEHLFQIYGARHNCAGVAASGGSASASRNCRNSFSDNFSGRVPA
jgi:hypothetical protein